MKCNSCNGIWNETKQIVGMSQVWHWIYNEEPVRMPKGWRVDANGHITNLPIELNVNSILQILFTGFITCMSQMQELVIFRNVSW